MIESTSKHTKNVLKVFLSTSTQVLTPNEIDFINIVAPLIEAGIESLKELNTYLC